MPTMEEVFASQYVTKQIGREDIRKSTKIVPKASDWQGQSWK